MQELNVLILGAGWTSTFLIPLLRARDISFAATTRDGRKVGGSETIKWTFDPNEKSSPTTDTKGKNQFAQLPLAKHILITFPLTGQGQSETVVTGYEESHGKKNTRFIQLGSTGVWQIPQSQHWVSRHSPYNKDDSRAVAEDELIGLGGSVLNLAGLWGGERDPKHWVSRVAKTKEDVKGKTSLHMIHGVDVARSIVAVTEHWEQAAGQRWMLTDGFVYDWWALFAGWADVRSREAGHEVDPRPSDTAKWVYELLREGNVAALPRSMEALGRCYDSREFWGTFQLSPLKARI